MRVLIQFTAVYEGIAIREVLPCGCKMFARAGEDELSDVMMYPGFDIIHRDACPFHGPSEMWAIQSRLWFSGNPDADIAEETWLNALDGDVVDLDFRREVRVLGNRETHMQMYKLVRAGQASMRKTLLPGQS